MGIVRVGNTVRRPRHDRSDYVDALLQRMADAGFMGTPRPLGYDDQGRQILTFVEGWVPVCDGPHGLDDAQIRSATGLIRAFHDATAAIGLNEDQEVVCHGDLGPHNTVFDGDRAVAIIDFEDDVRPGRRVDDFDQAVWGFAELADPVVPVAEQARRMRLMCDVYGGITPPEAVAALTARWHRAIDYHRAANLPGAVRVFEDLLARLAGGFPPDEDGCPPDPA
ncbi:phosphotransferase [Paractinoplanes durhamensis]|uniref:Phosphotransferase n=1 Tax=Paractinoplanes durhamensis TaxID=113563 RepID=A0ABQ3YWK3_9ACTN|nr:phosphotransferase [Actinoplanes durhamensis]GIE01928.1 phosphotransferase [Actinoplanes durhamensis]